MAGHKNASCLKSSARSPSVPDAFPYGILFIHDATSGILCGDSSEKRGAACRVGN